MKSVSIPVILSSPAIEEECTQYYLVEYRITGDPGWTVLPATTLNPIVVNGLIPSTSYDWRITRYCCSGDNKTTEYTETTPA